MPVVGQERGLTLAQPEQGPELLLGPGTAPPTKTAPALPASSGCSSPKEGVPAASSHAHVLHYLSGCFIAITPLFHYTG